MAVVGTSVTVPLVSVLAAVLVVAGLGKLRAPAAAADAMRAAGVPAGPGPARLAGGLEVAVGIAVLAAPSRPALAGHGGALRGPRLRRRAAAARSGAGRVVRVLRRRRARPRRLHAWFDAGAALVAAAIAVSPPPGIATQAARAPLAGVGLVAGCAAAAYAVSLVLRHLPEVATAYRPGQEAA